MAEIPEEWVEKVARALALREWGSDACFAVLLHEQGTESLNCNKCRADLYRDLARAALSALPIAEMVEALRGILNAWQSGTPPIRKTTKWDGGETTYWSPTASMVEAEMIDAGWRILSLLPSPGTGEKK